jgi:NAD(P)-dependent dehydrogenase (short-subunit alcohol dehydrogenase family)
MADTLKNKVVLVTGAGRGIGRSVAIRFGREGASVIAADLDAERAAGTAAEINAFGGEAWGKRVDVSAQTQVEQLVAAIVQERGRIDVLVNVAGIGLTRLFLTTTLEEWERVLQVNLTGCFLCSQAAARAMAAQGGGKIIHIASLSGQRGGTGRAAYGASKAGVTMLTKVMAVELARHGITVNEIAPGPVNTEMTAVTHDEATRNAYHRLIPMGRYAERDEISSAAVFLASAEATFINGHTLNVDGGFAAAGLMFELHE